MCNPILIAGAISAAATVKGGMDARAAGEYQNDISRYNARNMENEATRTRNVGVEAENDHRQKVASFISKQRASAAANNVDVNSGSALALQLDTQMLGEVDAMRIKTNYLDRAEAMDNGAMLTASQGDAAEKAGDAAFSNSLLTAAGKFATSVASSGVADKWFTPSSAAVTSTAFTASAPTTAFGSVDLMNSNVSSTFASNLKL